METKRSLHRCRIFVDGIVLTGLVLHIGPTPPKTGTIETILDDFLDEAFHLSWIVNAGDLQKHAFGGDVGMPTLIANLLGHLEQSETFR